MKQQNTPVAGIGHAIAEDIRRRDGLGFRRLEKWPARANGVLETPSWGRLASRDGGRRPDDIGFSGALLDEMAGASGTDLAELHDRTFLIRFGSRFGSVPISDLPVTNGPEPSRPAPWTLVPRHP